MTETDEVVFPYFYKDANYAYVFMAPSRRDDFMLQGRNDKKNCIFFSPTTRTIMFREGTTRIMNLHLI